MVRRNYCKETKANATAYIMSARDVTLTFPCVLTIRGFEGLSGAGRTFSSLHPCSVQTAAEKEKKHPFLHPCFTQAKCMLQQSSPAQLRDRSTRFASHSSNPGPPSATKHQQQLLQLRPSHLSGTFGSNLGATAGSRCSERFLLLGRCKDPTPGTAQPSPEAAPG